MELTAELIKTKTLKTVIQDWKLTETLKAQVTKVTGKKEVVDLIYSGEKLKWSYSDNLSNGKIQTETVKPVLVKPEFFEFCKIGNPWWQHVNFKGKKYDWIFEHLIIRNPKLKDIKVENIVFLYGNGHLAFSYDEKLIPTPFWGSYINGGHFDSDHYDLEKLLKHLQKHKSVLKESSVGIEVLKITEVPYYNQNSSGNLKHIETLIIPSKKELNDLYDKILREKPGGRFWSSRLKDAVLGVGYAPNPYDYLKINKFMINEKK